MNEVSELQQKRDEKRRFKLSKYFMGIELKKFEAPESVDFGEIAEDSVAAADALINALKNPPATPINPTPETAS